MAIPPSPQKKPHEITQHGLTRMDPYYWLHERDNPATSAYLKAENDYLDEVLAHTAPLQETLYQEMKGRIPESDSSAPQRRGEYFYYTRVEPGKDYPIYCRKPGTLAAREEILLDQNTLAEGQAFCALGAVEPSPDHSKLAYMLDNDGGEIYTLFIKDLTTGALLPDVIQKTAGGKNFGLAWANDNQALFYTVHDEAHRPYRLYLHALGSHQAQDRLVYEETDPLFGMYIHASRSQAYLLVGLGSTSSSEWRYLPLATPVAELNIFAPRKPLIEYSVDHAGDHFCILSNDGAQNFHLLLAPVSDPRPANWVEVIPQREDVTLEEILAFENDLVVIERKDGLLTARLSAPDAVSQVRTIPMPEAAYTLFPDTNPEYATRTFRFIYTSLVTPRSVIDYDMGKGVWQMVKQDVIPSGYDPSQFQTERLYASTQDGKRVPISLVYRKGVGTARDGSTPLLLYGYGSYGFSMDPTFNANRLSLLERGFIFAIAHIRGGADLGRAWYEDGKLLHKKNTFTDFIACAEYLVHKGWTSPEKLAIMGGSAGGLLVGAVMTMRPDLCKAAVAQVPFVDIVTTMSDPSIPLTTFEYDQWGNPEDPTYFEYMLSYSPYDNLRPAVYPDTLITTGLNDPRVAFWEPAKFTARLRDVKQNDSLVVLKTNFGAGHAGASGRYGALKDWALVFAFLIDRLGADGFVA